MTGVLLMRGFVLKDLAELNAATIESKPEFVSLLKLPNSSRSDFISASVACVRAAANIVSICRLFSALSLSPKPKPAIPMTTKTAPKSDAPYFAQPLRLLRASWHTRAQQEPKQGWQNLKYRNANTLPQPKSKT